MTYRRAERALRYAVVAATVLTSLCPLYFAYFLVWLYVTHGKPLTMGLHVASGTLQLVAAYWCAALLYASVPRLRWVLQGIACVAAAHAIWQAPTYWSFVQPKNLFHNMLAEPVWEMFGLVAIVLLCLLHLFVQMAHRRNDPVSAAELT